MKPQLFFCFTPFQFLRRQDDSIFFFRPFSSTSASLEQILDLQNIIERKYSRMESKDQKNLESFTSAFEPSIAIKAYVERLSKYLECSYESYICGMCLIERVQMRTGVEITSLNVHRMMLIALRVSTKFLDDKHHNNTYFAKIGGVSVDEFNQLEMAFLQALSYRLYVDECDFNRMRALIEQGQIMKPVIEVMCSISFDTTACLSSSKNTKMKTTGSYESKSSSFDHHELELEARLAATANSVFSSVFDF